MVIILLKEKLNYRKILLILAFFLFLHLSAKLILDDDFSLTVLTYYELENRHFYVIIKYLLPFIIFLYTFVFTIDLKEDYTVLILIRNPNKYSHIKAISLFIFGISIVYWGVYFLLFTFLTGTSLDLIGKEMLRSAIITCQISKFLLLFNEAYEEFTDCRSFSLSYFSSLKFSISDFSWYFNAIAFSNFNSNYEPSDYYDLY